MSNNKQSSVEILEDFLLQHCNPSVCDIEWADLKTILLEAKAMHKEEIVDALINGMHKGQDIYFSEGKVKLDVNSLNYCIGIAEDYYNETFNAKDK